MCIELKNLNKSYNGQVIFNNLNFQITNAGLYFISGKSGLGKSTLLNIIASFEKADSGTIYLKGNTTCIFQSYELIPELTVLENIRIAVDLYNKPFDEQILNSLQLSDLTSHYPHELSGGQKQRVGIARALYQDCDIILCDEPTESLDVENKEIVMNLLKELSKTKIVLISSHDINTLNAYYDEHYEIQNHQLVLVDKKTTDRKEISVTLPSKIHLSSFKQYMKKVIKKVTIKSLLVLLALFMIQTGLYLWDVHLFSKKNTLDALNGNIIYVNLYDTELEFLNPYGHTKKPIFIFDPITINGNNYKVNIYPMENASYQLDENEIIINTHTQALFTENMKGQALSLTYIINGKEYTRDFKVIYVIEEKDAYAPQIYYNYAFLFNSLNDKVKDVFTQRSSHYEVITYPKDTYNTYLALEDNSNISITHSILDTRLESEKVMNIYAIIFRIVEVICSIITMIYIFYLNGKDVTRNKTFFAILRNCSVALKQIKLEYFKQKIIYLTLFTMFFIPILYYFKLLIPLSYLIILYILYYIALFIPLWKFKEQHILIALKNNKDI